jgi:molecular chaperone GrpE
MAADPADQDNQKAAQATEAAPGAAGQPEEAAERHDQLLRALAESQNARRRAERAGEDARRFAVTDFSRELLSVVDNLARAIRTAEEAKVATGLDGSLLEGVRATFRQMEGVLGRFGVRRLEAKGAAFDPERHEAIAHLDRPDLPSGRIVDVLEEGYTIHDRLLRPARVAVAGGGPSPAVGDDPDPDQTGARAPAPMGRGP